MEHHPHPVATLATARHRVRTAPHTVHLSPTTRHTQPAAAAVRLWHGWACRVWRAQHVILHCSLSGLLDMGGQGRTRCDMAHCQNNGNLGVQVVSHLTVRAWSLGFTHSCGLLGLSYEKYTSTPWVCMPALCDRFINLNRSGYWYRSCTLCRGNGSHMGRKPGHQGASIVCHNMILQLFIARWVFKWHVGQYTCAQISIC